MRVLFTGKFVPTGSRQIGVLQSWIKTVRAECERLGHECEEWQPGMDEPQGRFDLGILANMSLTGQMTERCDETVCVSHGIIKPECPGDADRVYFVSEGVRDYWGRDGDIIRQPIDLDFWKPAEGEKAKAIRYSYRRSKTLCEEAAHRLGLQFEQVADATHEQARHKLQRAAVVFASGRAALEAMACGARTVIYDHRQAYQGPLMDANLPRQMRNSYSGRGGHCPTLDEVVLAAKCAHDRRYWVEQHHDARQIVRELIG